MNIPSAGVPSDPSSDPTSAPYILVLTRSARYTCGDNGRTAGSIAAIFGRRQHMEDDLDVHRAFHAVVPH